MKRSLLIAALLVFGLSACGEKAVPPPPPVKAPDKTPDKMAETPPAPPVAPAPAATPPASPAAPAPEPTPPPAAAAGPAEPLQPGVHYELLAQPQPTESGKKVEVIEFFWYACPHCNHLQPSLAAWLKRKPANVEFRRIPAVLQDSWLQLARTYYTIEAMGLVDKLHHDVFAAIHEQHAFDPRYLQRDPKPLFDWMASKGVDRQKFMDTYNSFAVTSRTNRATDLTRSYEVPYTPVLIVDGRYLISPSMKGNSNPNGNNNYDKFFQNLDQLIAQVRDKPRAGGK